MAGKKKRTIDSYQNIMLLPWLNPWLTPNLEFEYI